ncbi:MAG: glycine cleavage system protein H [Planctomycetota bacterium]
MSEIRFTESHEWARLEDDGVVTCGITQHAADELDDLTFLDFRVEAGESVEKGQVFGEIDSVKATSELYAPVGGTVEAINERFRKEEELPSINASPTGEGWLIKIKPSDPSEHAALMDEAAYAAHCS